MRLLKFTLLAAATDALRTNRRAVLRQASAGTLMVNLPFQLPSIGRAAGPATNEVVGTVNGIRRKRLGGSDIVVSEVGLGTQRWGGADFNSPDKELCHKLLDRGVLEGGINLIDTAEQVWRPRPSIARASPAITPFPPPQYPIPSSRDKPEGATEEIIGSWLAGGKGRRDKVVLASKITGGRNVNKRTLVSDCEGSLRRLGVDALDVYLLHWPARYTPQSNWGQSLEYDWDLGQRAVPSAASFREVVGAMGELMKAGKIRGYGACNDNSVGLMGMHAAARELGVPPPCAMENDYSLVNRRVEENGLSEASSPAICNAGFLAYNVLAGGMLTGKYGLFLGEKTDPPAVDDPDRERATRNNQKPRGRMDTRGWGNTLGRYRTTAARSAMKNYARLADEYGLKGGTTELALRFCAGRGAVSSSLVGHTSLAQLDATVAAFKGAAKGPLPAQLRWEIDRVHLQNRLPLFSNDEAQSDWLGEGFIGERLP
ncbi:aldo-keto reductase [Aureococcus anophagefferens]|uniref:Aldo-keto reductase n=1 Tax=Aureococcus anophagefferens TaxID=44056 RepID=A0ABR1GEE2_AURAN